MSPRRWLWRFLHNILQLDHVCHRDDDDTVWNFSIPASEHSVVL